MRIGCLTMQRNEGPLLASWSQYHGSIFGYEALYIVDNLSSDPLTISILHSLKDNGATVFFGYEDFEKKGEYVTLLVQELEKNYEWLFLMDTDEFLFLPDQKYYEGNPLDLYTRELAEVPDHQKLYRIDKAYWNIPYSENVYKWRTKKVGIRSGFFPKVDLGFHLFSNRETEEESLVFHGSICHLHFHNRKFPDLLHASRVKLARRVSSFDRDTLANYTGAGAHLTRYFFTSEIEYMEHLINQKEVFGVGDVFSKLKTKVPHAS